MKYKLVPILLIMGAFLLFACSPTALPSSNSPADITTEEPMAAEVTEAPTMSETEVISDVDNILQPDTQSKCYNPFFPIVEGASWTYQFDTGDTYSNEVSNVDQNSFTLTQTFYKDGEDNLVLTADWYCTSDGLLQGNFAQIDLLNQSATDGGPEMTFETIQWEGQTLPAPDLMQVGYKWTATYSLTGDVDMEGIVTTADATVTIQYKVGAIEEVIVPAGTFAQAYRVDSIGEIDIEMTMSGASVPLNMNGFDSSSWYVEGVGLVKTSDEFSGLSSGMELLESNMIP
jgi:hypothetical protein